MILSYQTTELNHTFVYCDSYMDILKIQQKSGNWDNSKTDSAE